MTIAIRRMVLVRAREKKCCAHALDQLSRSDVSGTVREAYFGMSDFPTAPEYAALRAKVPL